MKNLLAVAKVERGEAFEGIGTVGLEGGGDPIAGFASIMSSVIGILTVVAAIYFLFVLITGAIAIMSSGGEKGRYEDARKKLTVGVIGMAVAVSAFFIADLVSFLLGIENIFDFGGIIEQISPTAQ